MESNFVCPRPIGIVNFIRKITICVFNLSFLGFKQFCQSLPEAPLCKLFPGVSFSFGIVACIEDPDWCFFDKRVC